MDIRHLTGRMNPIDPIRKPQQRQPVEIPKAPTGESFSEILERVSTGKQKLTFSAHAIKRLGDRNISLGENDLFRIQEAVDRAASKGSKESLILDGNNAFVVNIPNRTIITAVDQMELQDRVFTQIDSAVLTKK